MILLVASTKDPASMNIRRQLVTHYPFEESGENFQKNPIYNTTICGQKIIIVTINREAIYYQAITKHFNPELIIYISRHSSRSGTPTLSVHAPGNLSQAQKGGISRKISIAPAFAMKYAFLELTRQKTTRNLKYKVSYECTHHGPSLDIGAMFVELGSSVLQWKDEQAANAVAHATMASVLKPDKPFNAVLGIGGPHYNEKFSRMALKSSFAFGHMIPKYAVPEINQKQVLQCLNRTMEKVDAIVLDWKGIKSSDKPRLLEALKNVNVEIIKV